jgi:hypothetical protein
MAPTETARPRFQFSLLTLLVGSWLTSLFLALNIRVSETLRVDGPGPVDPFTDEELIPYGVYWRGFPATCYGSHDPTNDTFCSHCYRIGFSYPALTFNVIICVGATLLVCYVVERCVRRDKDVLAIARKTLVWCLWTLAFAIVAFIAAESARLPYFGWLIAVALVGKYLYFTLRFPFVLSRYFSDLAEIRAASANHEPQTPNYEPAFAPHALTASAPALAPVPAPAPGLPAAATTAAPGPPLPPHVSRTPKARPHVAQA